jgi:hypothetical protein
MGFDPDKIPIVSRAFQCRSFPLADHGWRDVLIRSNDAAWNRPLVDISSGDTLHFAPHFGWKGHIEQVAAVAPVAEAVEATHQS